MPSLGVTSISPKAAFGRSATMSCVLILAAGLCWLVCTIAQVEKYTALSFALPMCVLALAGVAAILLLLGRTYRRAADVGYWPLVAAYLLLAASFGVLYPKAQRHLTGLGSDREDALRVELHALTHHQYPYDARTFRGNRPTPLPGAMLLAAPFYLLGRVALQNLLWAALFIRFTAVYFCRRSTALAFVFLFLIAALENLNDFDVGGDYMTNIMYVAVAIYLFATTAERPRTERWRIILSVILLGVSLSSRVIFLVAIPPLLAFAIQRGSVRRGIILIFSVLAVSSAVTLPVFAPHPLTRLMAQLHQNSDKLQLLPRYMPGWGLAAVAFLLSTLSFATRMTVRKIYLFLGLSSLVMLLPPMVSLMRAEGGLQKPLTTDLEYFAASAVFLSLWIFSYWEQGFMNDISYRSKGQTAMADI